MPIVVIGGGLTAIDTATESLAYYVVQVEKFLDRYETLVAERGEREVRSLWSAEETEIADEFLAHARAIRAERAGRQREGRKPRLSQLLNPWGGVTIAYRRRLVDSPSYTLNHEEVRMAMQEGIRFAECLTPRSGGGRRATAHARTALRRLDETGRRPSERSCCRRGRFWWPRVRSPTRCSAAKIRTTSRSTAGTSRRSTKTARP